MAFGAFDHGTGGQPMAEINMIPLIDVMLVLLVIFIITAPLLTHAVKVDLPKASSQANQTKPDNIQLAVLKTGEVLWNGEALDRSSLEQRLSAAAKLSPQPEVHIRGDGAAEYRHVAQLMSAAARAGLGRIGFVTDPAGL
jgi:biopolymer transport protein ExbD